MGLDHKRLQMCLLVFLWGWVALSEGTKVPGICVRISVCTIMGVAEHSMMDSNILSELAEAATKNQGGNKAIKGIKGLQVKDIRPPNVSMEYVPKVGMRMTVSSQITIAGKSFIGGTMEITVASNMTTESRMAAEKGKMSLEVSSCHVQLISCKTNLPQSMLPKIVNKFLNSTLGKVLPGMMCPAANKVHDAMNKKVDKMWEPMTVNGLGAVQFSTNKNPEITSHHARVCFESQMTRTNGEEVEMTTDPSVLSDSDISEPGEKDSDLTISVLFLNSFMELCKGALDQDISRETMDGGPELSCTALKEKVPSMEIPETCDDMMAKIRSPRPATWILVEGEASLHVPLTIEFMAQQKSVKIAMTLKILVTFTVVEEKLIPSMGDSSLDNLELISTEVGQFDPENLKVYILEILTVTTVPLLKNTMKDGMPLPSMMGADYGDSTIEIHRNAIQVIIACDKE